MNLKNLSVRQLKKGEVVVNLTVCRPRPAFPRAKPQVVDKFWLQSVLRQKR